MPTQPDSSTSGWRRGPDGYPYSYRNDPMRDPTTEEFWAAQERHIKQIKIKTVAELNGWVCMSTWDGLHFARTPADLGRPIHPGDLFGLEIIAGYRVTGMRDECGMWLFRETNAELAEYIKTRRAELQL